MTFGARCLGFGIAATIIGVTAGACRRDRPDALFGETAVGDTTLTSAESIVRVSTDDAVRELAEAQCAMDISCGRGLGGDHGNVASCTRHRRRDLGLELDSATTCAGGIDRVRLDRCLAAVRAEDCAIGNDDEIASAVACRGSELCPRVMPIERGAE